MNRNGEDFPAASFGRASRKYRAQRFLRASPYGNDAFFISFAAHQDVSHIELNVFEFHGSDFRNPQCASVEDLEHRAIADGEFLGEPVVGGRIFAKHAFHFFPAQ